MGKGFIFVAFLLLGRSRSPRKIENPGDGKVNDLKVDINVVTYRQVPSFINKLASKINYVEFYGVLQ